MKVIPHQKITYYTQLTPVQVQDRLNDTILENKSTVFLKTKGVSLFGKKQGKAYQGHVSKHGFTVSRIPSYHTPSLPIAHGKVTQIDTTATVSSSVTGTQMAGSQIEVSMQIQPLLMIGGGIFVFMLLNIISMFAKKNINFVIVIIIGALVVFVPVYFSIVNGFHQEVARFDGFLLQTLEAVHK